MTLLFTRAQNGEPLSSVFSTTSTEQTRRTQRYQWPSPSPSGTYHILTIKPHKHFPRPSRNPTYFREKWTATAATTRSNKSSWFKCRILPGEGPNCGSNFTMSFLVPQKFQVKSNLKEIWNWKCYGRITGEQSSTDGSVSLVGGPTGFQVRAFQCTNTICFNRYDIQDTGCFL